MAELLETTQASLNPPIGYLYIGEHQVNDTEIRTYLSPETIHKYYQEKISQFAVDFSAHYKINQELLITAIRNLLKKKNFLELFQQLLNEDITDDEFENEIRENSQKYVVNMDRNISKDDYEMILYIVSKIGFNIKELSHNDVAELFSIEPKNLLSFSNESER